MRIAIVSREYPPYGGGIGSWSSKAGRGLARLSHDVHLFTEDRAELPAEEVVSGVHVHRIRPAAMRPHSVAWAWAAAAAIGQHRRFDVVQACEWDAEALFCALRPTAPVVTRLATPHFLVQAMNHSRLPQRLRSTFTARMERTQARRSRRLISPTRALANVVAQTWGLDEEAIAIVPQAIDPIRTTGAPIPNFLTEVPYILYFGRLEVRKGVDVLIDALPDVLRTHPDVHCVFIGQDMQLDGAPFAEYARQRCDFAFSRLHFMAPMAHSPLFNIVAGASLVVIPSRWENLANTCLEAMALGRPIIATSGSGFDEALTNGVDGILVAPGDVQALAGAISSALADPEMLARMGLAAYRRSKDFTVERMAASLTTVYQHIDG